MIQPGAGGLHITAACQMALWACQFARWLCTGMRSSTPHQNFLLDILQEAHQKALLYSRQPLTCRLKNPLQPIAVAGKSMLLLLLTCCLGSGIRCSTKAVRSLTSQARVSQ
jgi:hypothetical protein